MALLNALTILVFVPFCIGYFVQADVFEWEKRHINDMNAMIDLLQKAQLGNWESSEAQDSAEDDGGAQWLMETLPIVYYVPRPNHYAKRTLKSLDDPQKIILRRMGYGFKIMRRVPRRGPRQSDGVETQRRSGNWWWPAVQPVNRDPIRLG